MARRKKTGPKPNPAKRKTHKVLVSYDNEEIAVVQKQAGVRPLATYVRERSLAS